MTLSGFGISVEDEQLLRPHWDHGVCLPLLIREFHEQRLVAASLEMLDHSANLPAR
jgi:hypothetical protein